MTSMTKEECARIYEVLREITGTGRLTERCLDGSHTLTVRIGAWPVGYSWAQHDARREQYRCLQDGFASTPFSVAHSGQH